MHIHAQTYLLMHKLFHFGVETPLCNVSHVSVPLNQKNNHPVRTTKTHCARNGDMSAEQ